MEILVYENNLHSFAENSPQISAGHDEYRAEIFVLAAWCVWNRRNALHFSRTAHPVARICSIAGNILQEFLEAQEIESVPPRPLVLQKWCPPAPDIYKVNFDLAVFRSSNLAGLGVIVRDNCGEPIGALSMPINLGQSVAEMEALACQRAVQFAIEIGLTRVIVEGDPAVVIEALLLGSGQLASYGNILDDIRVQAAVFQFVDFSHTSHVCNSVADALAKKASSGVGLQVWLEDLPANIAPFVLRDVH
ncbi:uncharacterized protein LOC126727718 [Quercus robur]|uniref:uncharacterized protein LOC126727718 n=1 Tax=Quercus robur TaxID=38942 RepID=UPI0021626340|nr:uncharacterized protein LOC126727718 [Quercus robur]